MTDLPIQPTVHAPVEAAPTTDASLLDRLSDSRAARIILVAAGAGLVAQVLFVGQALGINFGLWVSLVLLGALATRRPGVRIDPLDRWLPVAALALGWLVALRDDPTLQLFNLPAATGLTLASVVAIGGQPLTRLGARLVVGLGLVASAVAMFGAALLGHGLGPLFGLIGRGHPVLGVMARAMAIAVPLLIIFVALFSAADAIFAAQLATVANLGIDGREIVSRLVFAGFAGWLFAGAMAAAWLPRQPEPTTTSVGAMPRLGALEATIVLLLLDAIFAVFVALQAAYLFGGLDTLAVSGLTYAEYARRGFFELIAVAVLVGLVLLTFSRLVTPRTAAFRSAALLLALLTAVILVSALYRLGLYQAAYGWTELRLYALAMIGWLAVGLVLAAFGLATDRRRWLAQSLVWSALVIALSVNAIGPQAFVAERNLERAIDPSLVASGGFSGIDARYLGTLDADVVPAMLAALPRLDGKDAAKLQLALRNQAANVRAEARQSGWPSWNLARHRALEALVEAGY
ncbi:DUF4173 domain-containing protein [soil metagenome]